MQKTRRGISVEIMQCDGFIDLPATAQALYAQLVLTCDDEGFTASISKCKIFSHATDEDVELLVKKRFIYIIENDDVKVAIIKHWRASNWAKSGIVPSTFSERSLVYVKPNGHYTLDKTKGKPLCADTSACAYTDTSADVSANMSKGATNGHVRSNSTNSTNTTNLNNSTNTTQPKEDTNNQPDLSWLPPDDEELPI